MYKHPHADHALALQDKGLQSLRAPEPAADVPKRGRVPGAVGRAHEERESVPPAAAQDGLIPGRRPLWITSRTVPIVVCHQTNRPPIPRRFRPYRMRHRGSSRPHSSQRAQYNESHHWLHCLSSWSRSSHRKNSPACRQTDSPTGRSCPSVPRAAFSHSASVGKRFPAQEQYALASS